MTEELDRHFTATTYILDQNSSRTLLHWHEKLQTWLPPGGHLELNETPYEAAVREIEEETGIKENELIFVKNGNEPRVIDDRAEILQMPHLLLSELIEPGHYHLDWIFYALADASEFDENLRDNEFKWFDQSMLENEKEIFANVRELAVKGITDHSIDQV